MRAYDKGKTIPYVFLVLCSAAGFAAVMAAVSRYGPGVTHDSAAYMFSAGSFRAGKGFEYFGYPSPLIQWPPLYPILLAAAGLAGIGPLTAAGTINALAYGLIVFFLGRWMFIHFESRPLAYAGTLLAVFSVPMLQAARYMWTETIFILFFLLAYLMLESFMKKGKSSLLVWAGAFTALACLSRYAGAVIVPAFALFLLFTSKPFKRRVIDIFVYGVISVAPLSIWIIRNYIVSGTLMGVRTPSTYPLLLNMARTIQSLITWIVPDSILVNRVPGLLLTLGIYAEVVLAAAVVVVFIVIYAYMLTKREKGFGLPLAVSFNMVFSVIYIIYLITSATKIALEPINSRYLVPVYLPALIILLTLSDMLTARLSGILKPGRVSLVSAVLAGLFILYPAVNTAAVVRESMRSGAGGYSTAQWQDSKLAAFVRQKPEGAVYYSNSADAVYAVTGVRTYFPPKKSGPYMYGLEQFKKSVEDNKGDKYLIWFKNGVPSTLYGLDDISRMYGLEKVQEYSEGAVYEISGIKK